MYGLLAPLTRDERVLLKREYLRPDRIHKRMAVRATSRHLHVQREALSSTGITSSACGMFQKAWTSERHARNNNPTANRFPFLYLDATSYPHSWLATNLNLKSKLPSKESFYSSRRAPRDRYRRSTGVVGFLIRRKALQFGIRVSLLLDIRARFRAVPEIERHGAKLLPVRIFNMTAMRLGSRARERWSRQNRREATPRN